LRSRQGSCEAGGRINSSAGSFESVCGLAQDGGARPMQDAGREDCAEGRKFSILGFESTDGAITAGFDPNSSAGAGWNEGSWSRGDDVSGHYGERVEMGGRVAGVVVMIRGVCWWFRERGVRCPGPGRWKGLGFRIGRLQAWEG
jgi:hypothetical protein